MFFLNRKVTEISYGVLIDISSGSVGVAIVESFRSNPLPKILYEYRTPIRTSAKTATDILSNTRKIREALLTSLLTISDEGRMALKEARESARIDTIFLTCSAPWAYTVARQAHYTAEHSFKITKSLIESLIKDAEHDIIAHIQSKGDGHDSNFEIVENATIDITVNDYMVDQPLGLKGSSLALTHIAGLLPKEILETIYDVQDKIFPDTNVRAHTSMLVTYCILRDIFPRVHDACIIDVTGETTEVGIIEHNLLLDNVYVQEGIHSILRALNTKNMQPLVDMEREMQLIMKGEEKESAELLQCIEAYKTSVKKIFDSIHETHALPKQVFVIAPKPYEQFFKKIFDSVYVSASSKECSVDCVDTERIPIEYEQTNTNSDTHLAISASFFHKVHGCTEPKTLV